jgi:hypothetical protein
MFQTDTHEAGQVILHQGQTIGQTFVSRHAGLSGIAVLLQPTDSSMDDSIRLRLRATPHATEDIATATLPVANVTTPEWHWFPLPVQPESFQKDYFFLLELVGSGQVAVGTAPGDVYLDGALYVDETPQAMQMRFNIDYSLPHLIIGTVLHVLNTWVPVLATGIFLYILPGWVLLRLLWREESPLAIGEQLALAGGISLAMYPVLVLWTNLVGLQLGAWYAWLPGGIALCWLLYRAVQVRSWQHLGALRISRLYTPAAAPSVALVLVLAMIVLLRLVVIDTLEAPLWGDAYQHTMIAQILLDNNGLFDNWLPYAPYHSLSVHFGFPTAVAVFSWVHGTDSVQATLFAGQLLNMLAAYSVYPLAVRIAEGNRWAGVGAVLTAGVLSFMPAFYVNWGRYAQLAGQITLPVVCYLLVAMMRSERHSMGKYWLTGAVLAGMVLLYYRTPFFLAPFVLAWLATREGPQLGFNMRAWGFLMARLALVGGLSILFFLPWIVGLLDNSVLQHVDASVTPASTWETVLANFTIWQQISHLGLPWYLVVVVLLGVVAGPIRGKYHVLAPVLWVLLLLLLITGQVIPLPGSYALDNFAVLIFLYIPASLICGWLLGWFASLLIHFRGRAGYMLLWGALVITIGWASWGQFHRVMLAQPEHILVTRPDMRTMRWIEQHTAPQARFLVNGFIIYDGRSAVGSDAGWWIPLLTERANTMPPQYAMVNEVPVPADYTQQIVDITRAFETMPTLTADQTQLLCQHGITHVYIGQQQGQTGAGAHPILFPADFLSSTAYELVYHEDRVYIFELDQAVCEVPPA